MKRVLQVTVVVLLLVSVFPGLTTKGVSARLDMGNEYETETQAVFFADNSGSSSLFSKINTYRVQNGLQALSWDSALAGVCQAHSNNMLSQNELSHTLDGKGPADRLDDAGISYSYYTENVAQNRGYDDPVQKAFEQWVESSGHNANLLNSQTNLGAVGIANSADKGYFFTFMGIKSDSAGGGGGDDGGGTGGGDTGGGSGEGTVTTESGFTFELCVGESGRGSITITNVGEIGLSYSVSVSPSAPWMTVSSTGFSLAPGQSQTISITVTLRSCADANKTANITISSEAGTRVFPVSLKLRCPICQLSNNSVSVKMTRAEIQAGCVAVAAECNNMYVEFESSDFIEITSAPSKIGRTSSQICFKIDGSKLPHGKSTITGYITGYAYACEGLCGCEFSVSVTVEIIEDCCKWDAGFIISDDNTSGVPRLDLKPGETGILQLEVKNLCCKPNPETPIKFTMTSQSPGVRFDPQTFTLPGCTKTKVNIYVTQPASASGPLQWNIYINPDCSEGKGFTFYTYPVEVCCKYSVSEPQDVNMCGEEMDVGSQKVTVTNLCPKGDKIDFVVQATKGKGLLISPKEFTLDGGESQVVTVTFSHPVTENTTKEWGFEVIACNIETGREFKSIRCCDFSVSKPSDVEVCCDDENVAELVVTNPCPKGCVIEFEVKPNSTGLTADPQKFSLDGGESKTVKLRFKHDLSKEEIMWHLTVFACGKAKEISFKSKLLPIGMEITTPDDVTICNSVGKPEQKRAYFKIKVTNTGKCTLSVVTTQKNNLKNCDGKALTKNDIKIYNEKMTLAPGQTKQVKVTVSGSNLCAQVDTLEFTVVGSVPECPERSVTKKTKAKLTIQTNSVDLKWTAVAPAPTNICLPGGVKPVPWLFGLLRVPPIDIFKTDYKPCPAVIAPFVPATSFLWWYGTETSVRAAGGSPITFTLNDIYTKAGCSDELKGTFIPLETNAVWSRCDLGGNLKIPAGGGVVTRNIKVNVKGLSPGRYFWWRIGYVGTRTADCLPHKTIADFYIIVYVIPCTGTPPPPPPPPPPPDDDDDGKVVTVTPSALTLDVKSIAYKSEKLPGLPKTVTKQVIETDKKWLKVVEASGWKKMGEGKWELTDAKKLVAPHSVTFAIDTHGLNKGFEYQGDYTLTTIHTNDYQSKSGGQFFFFTVGEKADETYPLRIFRGKNSYPIAPSGMTISGKDMLFSKDEINYTKTLTITYDEALKALSEEKPNIWMKPETKFSSEMVFVVLTNGMGENASITYLPIRVEPDNFSLPLPAIVGKSIYVPPSLDGESTLTLGAIGTGNELAYGSSGYKTQLTGVPSLAIDKPAMISYKAGANGKFTVDCDDLEWSVHWPLLNDITMSKWDFYKLQSSVDGHYRLANCINAVNFAVADEITVMPETIEIGVQPNEVVTKEIKVTIPGSVDGVSILTPESTDWLLPMNTYLLPGENTLELIIDSRELEPGDYDTVLSLVYEEFTETEDDLLVTEETKDVPVKLSVLGNPVLELSDNYIGLTANKNSKVEASFDVINSGFGDMKTTVLTASDNGLIRITPAEFTVPEDGEKTVQVEVDASQLSRVGEYGDVIFVQAAGKTEVVKLGVLVVGDDLQIKLWIGKQDVTFNGQEKVVDGQAVVSNPAPFIESSRTMVPLRLIGEALGTEFDWAPMSGLTKEVYIFGAGLEITLFIGEPRAQVNGIDVVLDAPAIIRSGRTFVPLRFISEQLGAGVEWIGSERAVLINLTN